MKRRFQHDVIVVAELPGEGRDGVDRRSNLKLTTLTGGDVARRVAATDANSTSGSLK